MCLIGVLIAQVVQPKGAAVGDFHGTAQGGRVAVEQPRHFRARFQAAFAIGQPLRADVVNRASQAQAGQHIGQRPASRTVHQHIPHRHHRQIRALRQQRQPVQPRLIAAIIAGGRPQKTLARKAAHHRQQIGAGGFGLFQRVGRQGDQDHALPPFQQIGALQMALPLGRATFADAQQPGQPRPCGQIGGQGQPFDRTVGQHQPRPRDQFRQSRVGQGGRVGVARKMRHGLAAGMVGDLLRADFRAIRCRLGLHARQFLQCRIGPHHACQ